MNKHLPFALSLGALALSGCKPQNPDSDSKLSHSIKPAIPEYRTEAGNAKNSEVAGKVRKIVAEQLNLPPERVLLTNTWQQLEADSLDTVELVMAFEEEFHVTISDERAETLRTVGDAVQFLSHHGKP